MWDTIIIVLHDVNDNKWILSDIIFQDGKQKK